MAGLGGVVGVLLGWLGYQVGTRDEEASANGSVHAKLAKVREEMQSNMFWMQTPTLAKNSTDSSGTILRVTGPAIVLGGQVAWYMSWNSSYQYYTSISITIDGQEMVSTGTGAGLAVQQGGYRTAGTDTDGEAYYLYPICGPFLVRESLAISGSFGRDRGSFSAAVWHVPA